jgi:hypothetical protein
MKQSLSNAIEKCFVSDDQISRRNRKRSYIQLVPSLGEKKNLIFASVYCGYDSPFEIVEKTGLPIRTVAARLCEMKNSGFIEEAGSKKGLYGKDNTYYKICERYMPKEIDKTEIEKIINKFKKDLSNKFYSTEQIKKVLNQFEINPEIVNDIVVTLNLQFN